MLFRKKIEELRGWRKRLNRKPLILRGARQVGKTTLVNMFAEEFDLYIPLNLELQADLGIFDSNDDVATILQLLYLRQNASTENNQSVLIFIDEIQNSPKAVALLRYFYELHPEIFVIATGSLLESLLVKNISFPVGRVEYMYLYPFNFEEYLMATGNKAALDVFNTVPFPSFGYQVLANYYSEYILIGGMPEIIATYLTTKQVADINPIFDSLLITYLDDVEKYAKNNRQKEIIRHIIHNAFIYAGERIKFEGFANSNYKSNDVGECFRVLEKTFLLKLVYPTTQIKAPIIENKRKSPKLQVLDTGMINKIAGLQMNVLSSNQIDSIYDGKIAEHLVGQELIAIQTSTIARQLFWVKEKKQSNAEVDYLLNVDNMIIPIEVKAGKTGRLRSLMEFMDLAPHCYAIRIYSGELKFDTVSTIKGKKFHLMNLPNFLTGKIYEYIDLFLRECEPI